VGSSVSASSTITSTPIGPAVVAKLKEQRDYVFTFATEISIFLSQVILYRWIAVTLGKQAFGEFALARRSVTLIQPALLLGLTVALPRHLAFAQAHKDEERSRRLYGAAALIVMLTVLATLTITKLFAQPIAYVIFGSKNYSALLISLATMLAGIAAHTLAYSYFRGTLKMGLANILQIINLGLVPTLVFGLFRLNVPDLLMTTGACWIAIAVLFLVQTPISAIGFYRQEIKELLYYGLQRVVGDFFLISLLTLPAVFLAHVSGIEKAGAMAFGMSFLTMFGAIFAPASIILLPKTSRMIAEENAHQLRSHVRSGLLITFVMALALMGVSELFGGVLIRLYLGQGFDDVAAYLRLLALASVPYAIYCVLRGLIDAYHENGVNSFNLCISFMVFCVMAAAGVVWNSTTLIIMGLVLSLYVLCVLTLHRTWKIIEAVGRVSETRCLS